MPEVWHAGLHILRYTITVPRGCMAEFPVNLLSSLIKFDFEALMKDEDIKWLIKQLSGKESDHREGYFICYCTIKCLVSHDCS